MKKTILLLSGLFLLLQQRPARSQNCFSDSLQLQSQVQLLFSVPVGVVADRLNRPYCYVAGKEGGLSIYNISNIQSPQLAYNVSPSQFDSLDIMYLVQDSIYLYVALGNFFGTNPENPGMAILDISVPANPQVLDFWKWPAVVKGASTLLVEGNYAYLAAMTQGIFILNITNKSNITLESNYVPDPDWPVVNPNAVQAPNARGMAIKNDTLFLCYDAGGLRVIDVTSKSSPSQIAQYLNPGSSNKQEAFNHIVIDGNLAFISEDYCGLEVVDISNVGNLTQTGWWNPWGCELPSTNWNGCQGHTNQMVYDQQRKIIYLSSGDSELRIVDVSNPALPDSCNGWGPTGNSKACWGTDVWGPYIYITYINSFIPYFSNWAGFKVLSWPLISGMQDNPDLAPAIKLNPNPATGQLGIDWGAEPSVSAELIVYDMLGSCCLKKIIDKNDPVDISGLSEGVYLVTFSAGGNTGYARLVKMAP